MTRQEAVTELMEKNMRALIRMSGSVLVFQRGNRMIKNMRDQIAVIMAPTKKPE